MTLMPQLWTKFPRRGYKVEREFANLWKDCGPVNSIVEPEMLLFDVDIKGRERRIGLLNSPPL